jgi:hypothetical protein
LFVVGDGVLREGRMSVDVWLASGGLKVWERFLGGTGVSRDDVIEEYL